jgi:5-methylcytosine-specific restriction enzyme A
VLYCLFLSGISKNKQKDNVMLDFVKHTADLGTTEKLSYLMPVKSVRERVFKRDNYTCRACGFHDSHGHTMQIDHAISKADGGSDSMVNLQVLCQYCNNIKGRISAMIEAVSPVPLTLDYASYMAMVHRKRERFYSDILNKASNGFYRARAHMYDKVHDKEYTLTNTQVIFKDVVCTADDVVLEIKKFSLNTTRDITIDLLFTVASTGLTNAVSTFDGKRFVQSF